MTVDREREEWKSKKSDPSDRSQCSTFTERKKVFGKPAADDKRTENQPSRTIGSRFDGASTPQTGSEPSTSVPGTHRLRDTMSAGVRPGVEPVTRSSQSMDSSGQRSPGGPDNRAVDQELQQLERRTSRNEEDEQRLREKEQQLLILQVCCYF